MELKPDQLPELIGKVFVGVKFSKQMDNVAMSIAIKTADEKIFVESIDDRPVKGGLDWIVSFINACDVRNVVVDGSGGQQLLSEAMHGARLKAPILPKVIEVVEANASFVQRLAAKEICHMAQPSLVASTTNVEKRAINSNGGYGFRSINDSIDVALLDSVILAQWICGKTKDESNRQRIYC